MSKAGAGGVSSDPYSELAEADRAWLARTAAELRAKLRRSVQEVVESGRLLAAARRRLGRNLWRPWLSEHAQIPPRSAQRLVNVGTAFAGLSDHALARFTPTALYALAEPNVSQSVREFFVQAARDGEEVTAGQVAQMLSLQADTDTEGVPLKLATKDTEPPDDYHDPADVFSRENWHLLRDLVGTGGTVHLAGSPDAENEDELFQGFAIDAGGRRKHASGGSVEAVVLRLAGGVRKKVCATCGELKPLDDFCRRTDMPDGREYRCKRCEARRVAAHTARKAAERGAALKAAG